MKATTVALVVLSLLCLVFQWSKASSTPLANIAPLAALFLCSALYRSEWRLSLALPLLVLLVSDLTLSGAGALASPFMAVRYAVYVLLFTAAWKLRSSAGWPLALGLATGGAIIFYVATNTVVWADPATVVYPKSFAGWWQCLTIGDPRFPPSYLFFRNTLLGDLLFTLLFSGVFLAARRREQAVPAAGSPAAVPARS